MDGDFKLAELCEFKMIYQHSIMDESFTMDKGNKCKRIFSLKCHISRRERLRVNKKSRGTHMRIPAFLKINYDLYLIFEVGQTLLL